MQHKFFPTVSHPKVRHIIILYGKEGDRSIAGNGYYVEIFP